MELAPGEDAVRIVEVTTQDLEYPINLGGKAAVGLEGMDSNFERSCTLGEMLLKSSITCYREIVHERKSGLRHQTSLLI